MHPKDGKELSASYPSNVQPNMPDPRAAIFTRPSMLEPVPAPNVPHLSKHEEGEPPQTVENHKPCPAEPSDTSLVSPKSPDPHKPRVSDSHLLGQALAPKPSKTSQSEPEPSQDDSFARKPTNGKWLVETCDDDNELSGGFIYPKFFIILFSYLSSFLATQMTNL